MIIHAQPRVGFISGKSEMKAVIAQKLRQKLIALRVGHGAIEQQMRETRSLRQHAGDIGIAHRQFLGDDARGERVGAGATERLRQSERAQAELRGRVDLRRQQTAVLDIEPAGLELLRA